MTSSTLGIFRASAVLLVAMSLAASATGCVARYVPKQLPRIPVGQVSDEVLRESANALRASEAAAEQRSKAAKDLLANGLEFACLPNTDNIMEPAYESLTEELQRRLTLTDGVAGLEGVHSGLLAAEAEVASTDDFSIAAKTALVALGTYCSVSQAVG